MNTREITYVEGVDFRKLYPNGSSGFRDGFVKGLKGIAPIERIEVSVVSTDGPYTLVRNRHNQDGQVFIMPTELVKKGPVPYMIDEFKPILDRMHPNNWMYDFNYLYINYPEITITNSLGMQHTMYDLLVRIYMDDRTGSIDPNSLNGARISLTTIERSKNFRHSHLKTSSSQEIIFTSFCQGSGPFPSMLHALGKNVVTPQEFETFLLGLRSYLEWESIEGRPHISIRSLNEFSPELESIRNAASDHRKVRTILLKVLANHPEKEKFFSKQGRLTFLQHQADAFKLDMEVANICASLPIGRHVTTNYDVVQHSYIKKNTSSSTSTTPLQAHAEDVRKFIKMNNITPRIIVVQPSVDVTSNIVLRVHPSIMQRVLESINRDILPYTHKTIKLHGQRNGGETPTESIDVQGLDTADITVASTVSEW